MEGYLIAVLLSAHLRPFPWGIGDAGPIERMMASFAQPCLGVSFPAVTATANLGQHGGPLARCLRNAGRRVPPCW